MISKRIKTIEKTSDSLIINNNFEIDKGGCVWTATCSEHTYINYPQYLFKSRKELIKVFFGLNIEDY